MSKPKNINLLMYTELYKNLECDIEPLARGIEINLFWILEPRLDSFLYNKLGRKLLLKLESCLRNMRE